MPKKMNSPKTRGVHFEFDHEFENYYFFTQTLFWLQ